MCVWSSSACVLIQERTLPACCLSFLVWLHVHAFASVTRFGMGSAYLLEMWNVFSVLNWVPSSSQAPFFFFFAFYNVPAPVPFCSSVSIMPLPTPYHALANTYVYVGEVYTRYLWELLPERLKSNGSHFYWLSYGFAHNVYADSFVEVWKGLIMCVVERTCTCMYIYVIIILCSCVST